MIALGLLMLITFAVQGFHAISEPGWSLREAYVAGGLVLGGWLIKSGLAEWRHARNSR